MKSDLIVTVLIPVLLTLAGCKSNPSPSSASVAPSNANSAAAQPSANQNASTEKTSASNQGQAAAGAATKLMGAYEMTEIHQGGVVTLLSNLKTIISFSPGNRYARISKKGDVIYHSDSGDYRIEGPDKLVLTIRQARQTVYNPPREKTHTFTLSPDGEQLQLTSDDGKVAVFRKTTIPQRK